MQATPALTTLALSIPGLGPVDVTLTDQGDGRPVLLLHGGAGPRSVAPFAPVLADPTTLGARVLAPTHPGFDGTPRPDALTDIRGLAATYVALMDALELDDVLVVGNSIGGWIAAEIAALRPARVGAYVFVDAVGLDVPEHRGPDFFSLSLAQVAELAYFEPDRFRIDPSALPPEAQAALAGNAATLAQYAGAGMTDPSLRERLAAVASPVLVVWGEADGIVTPEYGRTFAAAIPGAEFRLLERTGHLPQLETPDLLAEAIREFASR